MGIQMNINAKIDLFSKNSGFRSLSDKNRNFITTKAEEYYLSFQDIRKLIDIALDLEMWDEGSLGDIWDDSSAAFLKGRDRKKKILGKVEAKWKSLKTDEIDYSNFNKREAHSGGLEFVKDHNFKIGPGRCPVASEKTRCCNLLTLDAVINCGFDCSYCSIQSFYDDNRVYFHSNLRKKLFNLDFDKNKLYHIGTGQSSDSLMWGNREGLFDDLTAFARKNANVILELKTKSDNIKYFEENRIPENIIVTWTLNTDTVIKAEEHFTASLQDRLKAARKLSDMGILVGFHFHPIIIYKGWEKEYSDIYTKLQEMFDPAGTAMVSFGTLTFIKPVIKKLRKRRMRSKVLQIPLEEIAGKYSYTMEDKIRMFKFSYDSFKRWHNKVFFYLCMEDPDLWRKVFGYEYRDNDVFEEEMKKSYMKKIKSRFQTSRGFSAPQ